MCNQEEHELPQSNDLEINITAKLPDGRSESITVQQQITWDNLRSQLAQRFELELHAGMHLRGVVRGRLLLADDTMSHVAQQAGVRDSSTIVIHCVVPFDEDTRVPSNSPSNGTSNEGSAPARVPNGLINETFLDGSMPMPFLLTAVGSASAFQTAEQGSSAMESHVLSALNSILTGTSPAPLHEILLCGSGDRPTSRSNPPPGNNESTESTDAQQPPDQQMAPSPGSVLHAVLAAVSSDNANQTVTNPPESEEYRSNAPATEVTDDARPPTNATNNRRDRFNRRGRENLRISSNAATRHMFQRTGVSSLFGSPSSRAAAPEVDQVFSRETAPPSTDTSGRRPDVFRVRFIRPRSSRRDRNRSLDERRNRPVIVRNAGYASAQVGNAQRLLGSTNSLLNQFGETPTTTSADGRDDAASTNQGDQEEAAESNRMQRLQDLTGKFVELDLSWECLYKLQESGGLMVSVMDAEQRERLRQSRISGGCSITRVYMQELYMLDQAANTIYQDVLMSADSRVPDDYVIEKCLLISALQGALASAHAKASLLLSTGAQDLFMMNDEANNDE